MVQGDIVAILKKEKRPMARGEIAEKIGALPNNVSRALKILVHYGEVKFKEIDRHEAKKLCGARRRIKLYFC